MTVINVAESVCVMGNAIEAAKNAYFSKRKKNQRIELKTYNSICFLKTGSVSIYRLENNLLTVSLDAPAILGLAQMRNEFKSHYLRCNTDCDLWTISVPDAINIFNAENLWMHAFDILTWHLQMYFQRENLLSHPKISDIVKEHLRFIW
ncbi:MAG TPA: transcriptional regulator, partial [Buttiauxella sp.]